MNYEQTNEKEKWKPSIEEIIETTKQIISELKEEEKPYEPWQIIELLYSIIEPYDEQKPKN